MKKTDGNYHPDFGDYSSISHSYKMTMPPATFPIPKTSHKFVCRKCGRKHNGNDKGECTYCGASKTFQIRRWVYRKKNK